MSDGRAFIVFLFLKGVIFLAEENTKHRQIPMPQTKLQSVIFTAVTAFIMVYVMTVYNIALASEGLTNQTFLAAIKGMWIEYIFIFLCAYFISSPIAKKCAFKIVEPTDRPIAIVLTIQIFTVVFQVLFASILGAYKAGGFSVNFVPIYLKAYCFNFIFALPIQLLIAGPVARKLHKTIFR